MQKYPAFSETFVKRISEHNADTLFYYVDTMWYHNCKDFPRYDSHKSVQDTYIGYWSFIATIIKINHFGKAIFENCVYIPVDLI